MTLMGVLLAACTAAPLDIPVGESVTPAELPAGEDATTPPTGAIRVVVPDEPSRWWPPGPLDTAAGDLAAIWGLPLLRVDESGQIRQGLVADWTVGPGDQGWLVRLELRAGEWTDGTAVTAADVVASLEAAQGREPTTFAPLRTVAADGDEVVLGFDAVYDGWPDLLVEVGSMLPAAVLDAGGETDPTAVTGGWFQLVEHEPGLRARFVAHDASPLGAPGVAELEVFFSPRYDTALAMLGDGRADVVAGYLALNAVARAEDIEGVTAAEPLGGTTVGVQFRDDGGYGGDREAQARRWIGANIDLGELLDGMLDTAGAPASTPWAGVARPSEPEGGAIAPGREFVMVVPTSSEVLAFAGRAIERDLSSRDLSTDLVSEPAPRFVEAARTERDAVLLARRTTRRPPLSRDVVVGDLESTWAGQAAGWPSAAASDAMDNTTWAAHFVPLFRIGVLHAWTADVEGVRPSAWSGAGFWDVGTWTVRTGE